MRILFVNYKNCIFYLILGTLLFGLMNILEENNWFTPVKMVLEMFKNFPLNFQSQIFLRQRSIVFFTKRSRQ